MAHLPPKVPNMTQNWPDFINSHQKNTSMDQQNSPSNWFDEFLDFSSARRGSHRRSISDSIAFLEPPMVEECRRTTVNPPPPLHNSKDNAGEFERFDDDQLMSMFTDDVPGMGPTTSNPSSPSDHNSFNDDEKVISGGLLLDGPKLKSEPEEVESSCKSEGGHNPLHATPPDGNNNSSEKISDPKRIKRILANRQSAQRSRVRKLQYISELERSVTSLQAEVSVLSPRVAFLDHQRLVLNVDNSVLKQRIAALAQDKVFKDAHQEALKREIERLRQIYYQQNLKKMENSGGHPKSPARAADTNCTTEMEQLTVN